LFERTAAVDNGIEGFMNNLRIGEALSLSPAAKEAFWKVVEDCLTEIHGLSLSEAGQRGRNLRAEIESPPQGLSSDIFYHAEPFDVACDLAGNRLDVLQHRDQYDLILDRQHW
jgi:hypothetical protein